MDRQSDRQTDRVTCAKQYALSSSKGGIEMSITQLFEWHRRFWNMINSLDDEKGREGSYTFNGHEVSDNNKGCC